MATVYATPAGFDPPDFMEALVDGRYDHELDDRIHAEYIARLAVEARSTSTGALVGEIVRFQIADGYAQYMVWKEKPLTLVHLAIHDAWSIPEAHARGLRLADVRGMVERDRALSDLFSRKG